MWKSDLNTYKTVKINQATCSSSAGNFGSGVHSYFVFLRFLVVLNFVSFFLIAGFVLAPSIVFRSVGSSVVNGTGNHVSKIQFVSPQHFVLANIVFSWFLISFLSFGFVLYNVNRKCPHSLMHQFLGNSLRGRVIVESMVSFRGFYSGLNEKDSSGARSQNTGEKCDDQKFIINLKYRGYNRPFSLQ